MIDGIKLHIKNREYAKKLLNNESFEFVSNVNNNTGEISKRSMAKYKNITIIIYDSGTVLIKGFLHKFSNDGKHNTARAINRILETPALFDNIKLISKDKLQVANFNLSWIHFENRHCL